MVDDGVHGYGVSRINETRIDGGADECDLVRERNDLKLMSLPRLARKGWGRVPRFECIKDPWLPFFIARFIPRELSLQARADFLAHALEVSLQ